MQKLSLLLFIFLISIFANAQTLKGRLIDPVEEVKIVGATVELHGADSKTLFSALSDTSGIFLFRGVKPGNYTLRTTSVGFEFLNTPVIMKDSVRITDLGDIYLPKKTTTLEGIVVVSRPPAVTQKGDTTQYSATEFKTNPDATVEDLIKKMPGITVDKSGNVTAQGESVKKVTVDGKDFFGDDATLTLRNLPAEVVDKIQVFDRLSEQAQLTGFDDGNSVRAINITTRGNVRNNGQFGRVYAGYGTDNRYQAGGNTSFFNGDRQLSIIGNLNNINQQNFASQDLLGVMGGGGGRGGRGGGFGGGGFGGSQSGINQTNAIGVTYSNKFGNKLSVNGSYFFNNSENKTQSETFSPTVTSENRGLDLFTKNRTVTNNNNHRFNLRFEYKLDSNNTIMYIPSWSFQNNRSWSSTYKSAIYENGDTSYISDANSRSKRDGFNMNNLLMYRHSFAKRGRSFSIALQANYSKNDGYSYNYTDIDKREDVNLPNNRNQYRSNPTNGTNYSARINYTEPIGTNGMMEFSYTPSIQKNKRNQKTYDFNETADDYTDFNPSQSNNFQNKIIRNNAGVNYRLGRSRDNQFSVGVEYQHSQLQSDRLYPIVSNTSHDFSTVLPNLRWMKKLGRYSNMRLFYRTNTDFPSIDQLQDVQDSSDITNVIVGNPNLKQSYSHMGMARYTYTNTKNNNSFIANFSYQAKANSIVSAVNNNKGATRTTYTNLNGYRNLSALLTYAFPLNFIKSNFNINSNYSYNRTPGMSDGLAGFVSRYTYGGSVGLNSNISEYVDFSINYNINYNKTNTTLKNSNRGQNYLQQSPDLSLNLLSPKGWFFNTSISYQNYDVMNSDTTDTKYTLWNAAVGKKFLKKKQAELKLSVFDILNQNNSFKQDFNSNLNVVETTTTRVLKQYFMLTFTYTLRNFGKQSTNRSGGERGMWREGPGGPPPGGGFGPGSGHPGGF
ncbi:MAG: TonB-dependent receptor [Niabella sp.]